ncbi:EamA family transporter, partial [Dapis sp. BLCC M126]|uniref:EamA family transporter n=1 Tax=Dapis sp. BLCC M126 TaxID=3400189 RepID=UPI003CF13F82
LHRSIWHTLYIVSLRKSWFNYGIKLIGATTAATIGATNPSLTAILAWLTIQETINGLQILGIVIVTVGILLLSQEHRRLGDSET